MRNASKILLLCGGLVAFIPAVALVAVAFRTHLPSYLPNEVSFALLRSSALALVVSAASAIVGFLVACSFVLRKPSKTEALLIALALVTPELPIAVSLQPALATLGLRAPDMIAVALGQIGFPTALAALFMYLRLHSQRAADLVATARTLGAGRRTVLGLLFRMAWPAVSVSFLSAAAFSLQDVVYPWFLATASFTVLPSLIFSRARFGLQPWMIWYGMIAVVCGAAATMLALWPEVLLEKED